MAIDPQTACRLAPRAHTSNNNNNSNNNNHTIITYAGQIIHEPPADQHNVRTQQRVHCRRFLRGFGNFFFTGIW